MVPPHDFARTRGVRARLWMLFVFLLAMIGLGTIVLQLTDWSGLGALGVALVILAFVILAVRAMIHKLAGPVEQLTEAMRRFGRGELDYRIPIDRDVAEWLRRRREHWRRHDARNPRVQRRTRGIDELYALQLSWNEMAERIEKQVKSQKELLLNVSHELRSPLARVRLGLELIPKSPESDARIRDIGHDLDELERLVDDVLTASRLDATGLPTHFERVDVKTLFDGLKDCAARDPKTAGKEVRVRVSPAADHVMGDPTLLRRALWNLVENAGKYGASPITLTSVPVEDGICLSVEDAGPGIPREVRATVFDAFVRAAKDRGAQGFGLGMTIAKAVAEVHGGSIAVAETLHGTRIDLVIPVG